MKGKKKYILVAIIVATTVFIWLNSAVSMEDSAQMSGSLTAWLQEVLHLSISEHFLRKTAHFCEYGLLGLEYALRKPQSRQHFFNAASAGLMTAVADESIQIVSGRGDQVSDILLDFSGFLTGLFLMSLLLYLRDRLQKRHIANIVASEENQL